MTQSKNIPALKEKISRAKSILLLLPPQPDPEVALSAVGLMLTLQKAKKQVQLGCSNVSNLQDQNFPHLKEIVPSVGSKNLIINFKYNEKKLDKVDYDIDDQGNFSLLIKPKKGSFPPDTSKIKYSYSGADADMVFTFGINSLEELGKLYSEEKNYLDQADITSLNHSKKKALFANFDFHNHQLSGIAEITASLIRHLKIPPNQQASSLFISRIYLDTNNLTQGSVTAETMETLGFLMRHGGKFSSSSILSTPPLETNSVPVFSSPPPIENTPLSPVPSEWKKPKIYRSSSPKKKL